VPAVFSTSANDFTVPPIQVAVGYQATVQAGTPAAFYLSQEKALTASTFLRIPGVDATEADGVFAALRATGVWDAQGRRLVADVQQAVAQAATAVLPASVIADGLGNAVANETARVMALHQFTPEFVASVDGFFARHVTP
jgi:hypothetical protein